MSALTPAVHRYQEILDHLGREGTPASFLKRASELVALVDLANGLGAGLPGHETLEAALRIVMRELQVERGALFVRREDGAFEIRASRGLPPEMPSTLALRRAPERSDDPRARGRSPRPVTVSPCCARSIAASARSPCSAWGRARKGARTAAEEHGFLRSVAACAARSDRERPHPRRAAPGEPAAVGQGVPAPQPVRHQPRAGRGLRGGGDPRASSRPP